MKLSARNQLKGTVGELVGQYARAKIDELGLAPGVEAYAVIKASNVIVGVEG